MRAVLQRVASAWVDVDGRRISEIGHGLLVLLGVAERDGDAESRWMAGKIAHLRIFEDDEGRMNRSVLDVGGQALAVSQFTLLGDARKGRRPSFTQAAAPETAKCVYEQFVGHLRQHDVPVCCGVFQAHMHVGLVNDGPVTIILDTQGSDTA